MPAYSHQRTQVQSRRTPRTGLLLLPHRRPPLRQHHDHLGPNRSCFPPPKTPPEFRSPSIKSSAPSPPTASTAAMRESTSTDSRSPRDSPASPMRSPPKPSAKPAKTPMAVIARYGEVHLRTSRRLRQLPSSQLLRKLRILRRRCGRTGSSPRSRTRKPTTKSKRKSRDERPHSRKSSPEKRNSQRQPGKLFPVQVAVRCTLLDQSPKEV